MPVSRKILGTPLTRFASQVDSYFTSWHRHVTGSHLRRSVASGSLSSLLQGHFELHLLQKTFLVNQHIRWVVPTFSETAWPLSSSLFKLWIWASWMWIMIRGLCSRTRQWSKHINLRTLFCLIFTGNLGGRWLKLSPFPQAGIGVYKRRLLLYLLRRFPQMGETRTQNATSLVILVASITHQQE